MNVLFLRKTVLNKNNFDIINSFFHCKAENFSEHPHIGLGVMGPSATLRQVLEVKHYLHGWC
jgi:hypothetical protein